MPAPAAASAALRTAGLSTAGLRCASAARIRAALDKGLVAQDGLKHGVLLALVAGEHAFIEGAPGCGKTVAAELAASAVGVSSYFYQFHRDTRVSELVGNTVVHRQREGHASASGSAGAAAWREVVRMRTDPGGVLTSEVCVLDDITRAPGEALNVLLRVLNERKFGGASIPLLSAIATANPPHDDAYTDPIDPAALDRFTVQLRVDSLIGQGDWASAASVAAGGHDAAAVAASADEPAALSASAAEFATEFAAAQAAVRAVAVPERVQRMLLRVLRVLRALPETDEGGGGGGYVGDGGGLDAPVGMSDRTFLVKGLRLLRAQAHVMGRGAAEPEDLHVLALLTTFRLPPEVHAAVPVIVQRVIDEDVVDDDDDAAEQAPPPTPPPLDQEPGSPPPSPDDESDDDGGQDDADDDRDGTRPSAAGQADDDDSEPDDDGDGDDSEASDESNQPPPDDAREEHDGDGAAQPTQGDGADGGADLPSVSSLWTKPPAEDGDGPAGDAAGFVPTRCDNVENVLKVLKGRIERGRAQATPHRGGQPRSYARPDDFSDFEDADPIETLEWLRSPTPRLPRRLERFRTDRSGSLALLRDTSMSMVGVWDEWAQSLSLRILELGRAKRMRIGYMEFNHRLRKVVDDSNAFFSRDFDVLEREIAAAKCSGVTDYQKPLTEALAEFRESSSRRHDRHILFLTDGLPTAGCKTLHKEMALAEELGVFVHTLFIGSKPYPDVLCQLAETTRGVQFRATYDHGLKTITVSTRRPGDY